MNFIRKWILEKQRQKRIKKYLNTKKREVYELSNNWGDSIIIHNWDKGIIRGHKYIIPSEGSYLKVSLKNGGIGIFEIVNIDRQDDPPDMFFANILFVDYMKNLQ